MNKGVDVGVDLVPLFGASDENRLFLEKHLNVHITVTPSGVHISGPPKGVRRTIQIVLDFEKLASTGVDLSEFDFVTMLGIVIHDPSASLFETAAPDKQKPRGRAMVKARNASQAAYLEAIAKYEMVFGIGPAGTGKTYLAVAAAVQALLDKQIRRIVLVRPIVEAGEKLGFLPGTFQEKVDPYLRPLYDALDEFLGSEKVKHLIEKGQIEVATLAYMRGRTIKDSFILADECQNTTVEQMKLLVTRLGPNSKLVVTGDVTQIDLPKSMKSGLVDAAAVLKGVEGISFHQFNDVDIVRHPLVAKIVAAYGKSTA